MRLSQKTSWAEMGPLFERPVSDHTLNYIRNWCTDDKCVALECLQIKALLSVIDANPPKFVGKVGVDDVA